jgi:hypothetical protein
MCVKEYKGVNPKTTRVEKVSECFYCTYSSVKF